MYMLENLDRFGRRYLHWITLFFIALVLVLTTNREKRWTYNFAVQWDSYGYAMYNSTLLLHKDFKHPTYLDTLDVVYHPAVPGYGRHVLPNGNTVLKYTCGNSIMAFPFYYMGHREAKREGLPVDGMSPPYQKGIAMSMLFWGIAGLFMMALALRQRFSPLITAITLVLIGLGTNFLHYAAIESGMTHPLNFFWVAFGTWAITRWLRNRRWTDAALFGVAIGFIGLVRPTDLVYAVFAAVLLLAALRDGDAAARRRLLLQCVLAGVCAFALFSIQLGYWHWVSGHWLVDSYQGEHFNFTQPHIIDGLISYRKGWFVYTPIALFATLGIAVLWRRDRILGIALAVFWLLNVYVTFSWVEWWYGGGFGARALIQSLGVLALPLAALVDALRNRLRGRYFLLSVAGVFGLCLVLLNLFQTLQYNHTVLHWDRMSKETYWKVWGRTNLWPEEFKQLYGE